MLPFVFSDKLFIKINDAYSMLSFWQIPLIFVKKKKKTQKNKKQKNKMRFYCYWWWSNKNQLKNTQLILLNILHSRFSSNASHIITISVTGVKMTTNRFFPPNFVRIWSIFTRIIQCLSLSLEYIHRLRRVTTNIFNQSISQSLNHLLQRWFIIETFYNTKCIQLQ